MSSRVDLHLRVRVSREKRAAFDAFLREATPFYEAPGGIRIRLVQNEDDPTDLIEIVDYASEEKYRADRRRAAEDPAMRDRLAQWRGLLEGRPEVVAYFEQPIGRQSAGDREQPTLRTARLSLRPFEAADADAMLPLIGDKRVAAMTANIPHPYEPHHAAGWLALRQRQWREGSGIVFAICTVDPADPRGRLVGAVGLHGDASVHKKLELGYWIGVPFWGNGYATEAARATVDFGFRELGLNRIHACHFAGNGASGRVLEKIGMQREGVARSHILKWGEPKDSVLYGMLRSEWEARRTEPRES